MPQQNQQNEGTSKGRGKGNGRERGIPQEDYESEGINRGRGRGYGRGRGMPQQNHDNEVTSSGQASRPFKRPRMAGFGVLVGDDGFTTLNPGMPSRRVIDIVTRVPRRSNEVTGDIGYQPSFGMKWKGKAAINSNTLQQIRGKKRVQTRSAAAALNQNQSRSTTKKTNVP